MFNYCAFIRYDLIKCLQILFAVNDRPLSNRSYSSIICWRHLIDLSPNRDVNSRRSVCYRFDWLKCSFIDIASLNTVYLQHRLLVTSNSTYISRTETSNPEKVAFDCLIRSTIGMIETKHMCIVWLSMRRENSNRKWTMRNDRDISTKSLLFSTYCRDCICLDKLSSA